MFPHEPIYIKIFGISPRNVRYILDKVELKYGRTAQKDFLEVKSKERISVLAERNERIGENAGLVVGIGLTVAALFVPQISIAAVAAPTIGKYGTHYSTKAYFEMKNYYRRHKNNKIEVAKNAIAFVSNDNGLAKFIDMIFSEHFNLKEFDLERSYEDAKNILQNEIYKIVKAEIKGKSNVNNAVENSKCLRNYCNLCQHVNHLWSTPKDNSSYNINDEKFVGNHMFA